MFRFLLALILISNGLTEASAQILKQDMKIKPPLASKKPFKLSFHFDDRIDDYYWLKDRKNHEVIKYLKSENKYFKEQFKPAKSLQIKLFNEIKGRIKEDDSTYPLSYGPYQYYTRFQKDKQYPIYARKLIQENSPEQIIFDINKLAKGHSFYNAEYKISPDHKIAALIFDTVGRRFYNIKFKNLTTGRMLKYEIKSITNNVIWSNDSANILFVKQDADTLRFNQVFRFNLKEGTTHLVYEEKQETFDVSLKNSLARKHIFINITSTLSSEVRVIPSDTPTVEPQLLFARENNHEYSVSEDDNYYYILSNKNAKNFKLLRLSFNNPQFDKSETVVANREFTFIDDFLVFKNQIVLATRENGLTQLEVLTKSTQETKKISFIDSAFSAEIGTNVEYESSSFRYIYQSLRKPPTVYDYIFSEDVSKLRKTKEIPNFDSNNYVSERVFAKARDGRLIPVSLLMTKQTKLNSTAPLLIYGYGAYGSNMDPWFSVSDLSLIDRGFIYAIAHVRGGGEMGRYWTDEGRTLNKKNTFFDFIDVTEFLINQKYAAPDKIFAMGGSAGGLLIGALANLRPDLYKGLIAQVPFVDVLTTMLDSSIPLTTAEYDEWGNPNDKKNYEYIKSYSPYDNVRNQSYPNMLVTTGLHDSQVQYWEPAKWIARLRSLNTGSNLILLKTDMKSGHGGKSGRFDQIEETAVEYAFILGLLKEEKSK